MNIFLVLFLALNSVNLPYFNNPPTIDGDTTDVSWKTSYVVKDVFTQFTPTFGEKMEDTTIIKMGYDENNLYLLFICYQDTATFVSQNAVRDAGWNQDEVGLMIDPLNSHQELYGFMFGLSGSLIDYRKLRTQGWDDTSWNGDVDYAVKKFDRGYIVEARIPFSNFRREKGKLTWGLNFARTKKKDDAIGLYVPLTKEESIDELFENLLTVVMEKAKGKEKIEIVPYGIWGKVFGDTLNEYGDAGFDMKVPVSSYGVANFTFNPDFNQLEGDPLEFDFNTIDPIYYPEYRPFFLEEKGVFEIDREIFYSRKIVNPFIATRYTYKDPLNSAGIIVGMDQKNEEVGSNDAYCGVERYIRQIGESTIGIMGVERITPQMDTINGVASFNANIRLKKTWNISFVSGYSYYQDDSISDSTGLFYDAELSYAGNSFNASLGFEGTSPDYTNLLGYVDYLRRKELKASFGYYKNFKDGFISSFNFSLFGTLYSDYDKFNDYVKTMNDSLDKSVFTQFSIGIMKKARIGISGSRYYTDYFGNYFDGYRMFIFFFVRPNPVVSFGINGSRSDLTDFSFMYLGEDMSLSSWLHLSPMSSLSFSVSGNYDIFYTDTTVYASSYSELTELTPQWQTYSVRSGITYTPNNVISFDLSFQMNRLYYEDWYLDRYQTTYGFAPDQETVERKLFALITYKPANGDVIYIGARYPEKMAFFKFTHRFLFSL